MLDTIPARPLTMTPAWREHLAPGDIVLFAFPVSDPDRATPKARPCLVLEIRQWAGERYALLAYGTSSDGVANRGLDILVGDRLHYPLGGLDEATRFVGRRRLLVHLGARGFALSSRTGSPVIGRIDGPALARMHRVRARLQAEADIAAERRADRRRTRRRDRGGNGPATPTTATVVRHSRKATPAAPARPVPSSEDRVPRRGGTLSLAITPTPNTSTDGAAR